MTSLERVLATLGYKEPDRVPLILNFSIYGAKEVNISIKEYLTNPAVVVETQLKMREKYSNDCVTSLYYSSIEHEAFGGTTIFRPDGPPNAGPPIIKSLKDIDQLITPSIEESKPLQKTLTSIAALKKEVGNHVPILGAVISPFSLPIMQMGFDKYLDLLFTNKPYFEKLININQEFCVNWANAQLNAGATAICYVDPVSSPSIITREMYKKTGWEIAKRTLPLIKSSSATHFASGRVFPVIDDLAETGTSMIAPSSSEDIGEVKLKAYPKMAVIGNLNGIEMCRWSVLEAEAAVKNIITKAGKGGGLIISDNHGEIPYQVSEKTLLAICRAVNEWGNYPLNWIK